MADLERLNQIRPDKVDWVFEQTQLEAEHRRKQENRIVIFKVISGILGQLFGLVIGLSGAFVGGYVALHDEPGAGMAIASVSIGTLAVAYLRDRKHDKGN